MYYLLYILAAYTVLYAERDPSALAKYRLWKSVGFVLTYSVSFHFFSIQKNDFSFIF
jgi:hypothetical protein